MPLALLDGTSLYYEDQGQGPAVMLVPGLASDSQSWGPLVPPMAARCRLVMPDNRGAGRTLPLVTPLSIARMADDCMALARHLGLGPVVLLGHSMGGMIALECARRYPALVGRLILAATTPHMNGGERKILSDWAAGRESGQDLATWFQTMFRWLFTARFLADAVKVQAMLTYALENPYLPPAAAFRAQVQATMDVDLRPYLAAVKAPTLVLCGEEDVVFPPGEGIALAQALPHAQYRIIPHAAHSIHLEQAQAMASAIFDFLDSDS